MSRAGHVAGLRFGVLGALEVRRDGRQLTLGGPRQRALLAVLLLHRNTPLSSDRLIDRLWGDAAPANAANALQVQVSRLRVTLAGGTDAPVQLLTCPSGYLLQLGEEELDADSFERLAEDGGRALAAGRPERAAQQLREALDLWRGPALADVAHEPFLQTDIAHLEELRIAALEERIQADLALGRHGAVIAELERLVAEEPLRERPRGQLMLALYRCGRQAQALEVYRSARETLVAELGLEPSPALASLEGAILRHDASVLAPPCREPAPVAGSEPAGDAALPLALAAACEAPFVPRPRELDRLAGTGGLLEGRPRVTLLSGECGAGKTRLAAELARRASRTGWTVLYGRADEGSPIPYQPFAEALRERRPEPDGADASPPCDCQRRFEALTAEVVELARRGPVLLVLDDLHAADDRTLLLLRHVARAAHGLPLAVLGLFREGEPDPSHGRSELAVELRRGGVLDRVVLGGFDDAQTAAAAADRLPGRTDPAFVRGLCRDTGGNPLLIAEVLGAIAAGAPADPLPIPETVHAIARRRLARLGANASEVLVAAALIGSHFGLETLDALYPTRPAAVLDALDLALASGLIAEVPGDEDRYAFSPPLLRQAICAIPSAARRRRVHRRVEALGRGEVTRPALQAVEDLLAPALLRHAVSAAPAR